MVEVVVVENHHHISPLGLQPATHRFIGCEEGLPLWTLLMPRIVGVGNGWGVRRTDAADQNCHGVPRLATLRSAMNAATD